jgi:alanine-synthesizing transaminase
VTKQSDQPETEKSTTLLFSRRTDWHRRLNKLSELYELIRKSGKPILDLTNSNPTECGIEYPEEEILAAFKNPALLKYQPDPRGLLSAREAISNYYKSKKIEVDTSNIFLTASTSEAYSFVFKLLCNAGENVLVPKPSYPLFDYLAQLNDVELRHYHLQYDHEWQIDIDSIKNAINQKTKAIVLINPHNPTGMFLKKNEYREIIKIAKENHLALIVDEVFIDYAFQTNEVRISSTAGESEVLTFTLNSISKMVGLPQMKLGWIIINGPQTIIDEAMERLEIICDTFLSVNTPVQVALPKLLGAGKIVQQNILDRIRANYSTLKTETLNASISLLSSEGGWYGILRVPRTISEEEWALQLLEKKGVYLFPGYFFDFDDDGYLVVSLLVENSVFKKAVREIVELNGEGGLQNKLSPAGISQMFYIMEPDDF